MKDTLVGCSTQIFRALLKSRIVSFVSLTYVYHFPDVSTVKRATSGKFTDFSIVLFKLHILSKSPLMRPESNFFVALLKTARPDLILAVQLSIAILTVIRLNTVETEVSSYSPIVEVSSVVDNLAKCIIIGRTWRS